jgi:hypothetical protein
MSFGPIKVFTLTLASAGTSTSALTMPGEFQRVLLEIPTMTSSSDLYIQGSTDGTTFRRVMQDVAVTTSVQVNTFTIASAATNRFVPLNAVFPYMKVEATTASVTAVTFKLICY